MTSSSENSPSSFRNLGTTFIPHHPATLSPSQFHALGGTQTTYDPPPSTQTATPFNPTTTSIITTQGSDESAAHSDKVFRWIFLATTIGILIIAIWLGWRIYNCDKNYGVTKEKARVVHDSAAERGRFELPTQTAARVAPPRVEMADLSEMNPHAEGRDVGIGGDGQGGGWGWRCWMWD